MTSTHSSILAASLFNRFLVTDFLEETSEMIISTFRQNGVKTGQLQKRYDSDLLLQLGLFEMTNFSCVHTGFGALGIFTITLNWSKKIVFIKY